MTLPSNPSIGMGIRRSMPSSSACAGVVARERLRRRRFVDQALGQVPGPETSWISYLSEHHSGRRLLDAARLAALDLQQVIDDGTRLVGHVPSMKHLGSQGQQPKPPIGRRGTRRQDIEIGLRILVVSAQVVEEEATFVLRLANRIVVSRAALVRGRLIEQCSGDLADLMQADDRRILFRYFTRGRQQRDPLDGLAVERRLRHSPQQAVSCRDEGREPLLTRTIVRGATSFTFIDPRSQSKGGDDPPSVSIRTATSWSSGCKASEPILRLMSIG